MRPLADAEIRADELLGELEIDQVPVPVEKIARRLGADISYEPYDGEVSGMLYRADDTPPLIGVNSTHAKTRQRFTVAHEIGHLVLHKGKLVVDTFNLRVNRRDNSSNLEEIEANAFAAELLMPHELVARELDRLLDKEPDIGRDQLAAKLAKTFTVSPVAMGYRLENLGILDPAALTG